MKHEDWVRYRRQEAERRALLFGERPKTDAEKVAELRAEVDGLAGRLKAELLAELKVEVERLIESYQPSAISFQLKPAANGEFTEDNDYANRQRTTR